MKIPKGYKVVDCTNVKRMSIGSEVYVGEIRRIGGLSGGYVVGIILPYEVGRRNGKVVVYRLPHKDGYISIRNYKTKVFLEKVNAE